MSAMFSICAVLTATSVGDVRVSSLTFTGDNIDAVKTTLWTSR